MSILNAFSKVIEHTFTKYRGTVIERTNSGFKVFGKAYPSIEDAKKAVDDSYQTLYNSINKDK